MDKEIVHGGLIISPPPATTYVMGNGQARGRYGAAAALDLNPSGDWRKWTPKNELQKDYGFDTNGCGIFALYKPWIMLGKFHGFEDFPSDLSERYGGSMCEIGPDGSEPIRNAELTRDYVGIIPQEVMPWNDRDIDTFPEFYDMKQAMNCLSLGKEYMRKFDLGYEQVWDYKDKDRLTGKEKTELLRKALQRGPIAVSVNGNYRTRSSAYYKDDGDPDTHFITVTNLEPTGARIMHDQYDPFIKRFEKDYNHEIALVFFLKRKDPSPRTWWSLIADNFTSLWLRLSKG